MNNTRYGLCCISLKLQEHDIQAATMTRKRFLQLERKQAETILADRTLNNVFVLKRTLEYCAAFNYTYRVSSNIMPLETLPGLNLSMNSLYNVDKINSLFQQCSEIIKTHNIRCSTHPDQFVVPASANIETVNKSILELSAHARVMDLLDLPRSYDAPINIHMNCFKGDIQAIADRFINVYNNLPHNVKSRLVLEVEDKKNSWGIYNLYNLIYKKTGIPITYDSLHFRRNNPENISPEDAVTMCKETWGSYKPLFHFSNGKDNPLDNAHSEYVYELHSELFAGDNDVEFEFKAKDLAIERFKTEFNHRIPNLNPVYQLSYHSE